MARPLKICWQCLATKGTEGPASLRMAFTDVDLGAPYWATMFTTAPYTHTPAYKQLLGYDDRMIAPDLLHVWHLGVGRDLAASTIAFMLSEQLVFQGSTVDERLANATLQLKTWAQTKQLGLKLKKLSRSKLGMAKQAYPELKSNGYDTYIVVEWLLSICNSNHGLLPREMSTALWCASHVLSLLNSAPHYLSQEEQTNKEFFGQLFMKCYVKLAKDSLRERKRLWRLRPKLHILHHIFRSCPPSRLNPNKYSTWVDEDGLKRLMKVLRMADARTAPSRLLERFLLKLPGHWMQRRRKMRPLRRARDVQDLGRSRTGFAFGCSGAARS